jgi:di/tricarboxylate transporter
MRPEIVSIVVLVLMFVIATTMPVNLGVLALVAAVLVGTIAVGISLDEVILGVPGDGEITGGFPGDLFVLLVGLTYLFALAQNNGTVDLVVQWSMRLVRGRLAAVPWIFFFLTALLSAIGALFAVAIVAPLAMPFARRYGVNLLLMGMMVVHGALGGAFSPITVYGAFVNETMVNNGLPSNPTILFVTPLVVNVVVAVGIYLLLGGRRLIGQRVAVPTADQPHRERVPARQGPGAAIAPGPASAIPSSAPVTDEAPAPARVGYEQVLTLIGLVVLAVGSVAFDLDVGFLALAIAVVLRLAAPKRKDAVGQVSWSTVLLICGVITYVGVLQAAGTVEYISGGITAIGSALVAALLLCYLGGVLSAFASSVGILGVAIPLAVPFLQEGAVSAVGMVAALAVATTIVDVSPFSTNGALILANAPSDIDRDRFYRQMLAYAGVVVVVGPLLAWLLLVVPGWL